MIKKIFANKITRYTIIAVVTIVVLTLIALVVTNIQPKITAIVKIPATLSLPVPFSVQAPDGNWERNEDCEETSITMANAYLNGITQDELAPEVAQASIDKLRAWEKANIGYNANTGATVTSNMAAGTFGLKVRQIKNYSETDLKKELLKKNVILLPINAQLLDNPNYYKTGPFYHMIVVRGYNEKGFIVNDSGTDKGKNNVYSFAILKKAAADWSNSKMAMDATLKIALIVSK